MSEQINKILASTSQSFTTGEQAQARANINAAPAGDYAYNSSLSSKMDSSASSQFYPATNPSGFVGSAGLSSKQDASAMSSYVAYSAISADASGNITAIAGSSIGGTGGGVDSATVSAIASSYAESAASSKADSSALSAYALSSNVSGVIDTVSSNSASWGGGGVTGLPITGSDESASATYGVTGIQYEVYDTSEPNYVTGNIGPFEIKILRTLDGVDYSAAMLTEQSLTFLSGSDLGTVDVESISAWNSTFSTVSSNSASWGGGGATGDYVEKSATVVTIGDANTANYTTLVQGSGNSAITRTFAQGSGNRASLDSLTQGAKNSAYTGSFAQGIGNNASSYSFAQGGSNYASSTSFAQGYSNSVSDISFAQGKSNSVTGSSFAQGHNNTAKSGSFAQGRWNSASSYSFAQGSGNSANLQSFAQGYSNTASGTSFAQGYYVSAVNTAAVFGTYNLRGDGSTSSGDSAAFAIGDGTAGSARHDLMLVTKNGEITMYSSTADTVGTGIMSSLRALSAAGRFESGRVSGTGFQPTSALTDATLNNNWVRRSVTDGTSTVSSYAFKSIPQVSGFYALNGNGGWLAIQPSAYSVNMFNLTGDSSNYDWEQESAYPSGLPYDMRIDFIVYGTGAGYVLVNLDAAGNTADLRTGESASMFYDHTASSWHGQVGTHNIV